MSNTTNKEKAGQTSRKRLCDVSSDSRELQVAKTTKLSMIGVFISQFASDAEN